MHLQQMVDKLSERLAEETRYVDLCMVFRLKNKDGSLGEEIFRVGGRWDTATSKYLEEDPADLVETLIKVNLNQRDTVEHFRDWLQARIAGGQRQRVLLTGGNRRGGKSFIGTALACAAGLAIPGALIWYVSPTLKKRAELERYTKEHTPRSWRSYSVRDLTFRFTNGSTITNITGDNAEDLKRGEADLIFYNEPQTMSEDVLTYGAPAIIDHGGLLLFAGNPARSRRGVWFTRLVKAVESGKYTKGDFCRISREDNPDIDHLASTDISELMHLANPEAARADDDGIFMEPGNFVYAEHFDERRNTVPHLPSGLRLITSELIRSRGVYGKFDILNGVDFQGWPFNAGVSIQVTGDIKEPTFYVTGCLMKEGIEDLFLDEAYSLWAPDRTLWIGDPSGHWQNAHHTKGRSSFEAFRARRCRIEAPQEKVSDRGSFPAHPPIEDSVNIINHLLDRGRLIICLDNAGPVSESLQKCEINSKGKPRGRWSHLTDALRYAIFWATPKPDARAFKGPPPKNMMHSMDVRPSTNFSGASWSNVGKGSHGTRIL